MERSGREGWAPVGIAGWSPSYEEYPAHRRDRESHRCFRKCLPKFREGKREREREREIVGDLWCLGGDFGSLRVLSLGEEEIELADEELLCTTEVVAGGQSEGKLRVGQSVGNVWDYCSLVH